MSMEKLWNWPLYKTVIDMWKNLSAWQTLTLLADGLGNGQRCYSSFFWTLPLSTALLFSLLVVQNYHTVILDCKTKKTSPIHEPTKKTFLETHRHWLMQCKRIRCLVCLTKHKTITKYKCSECDIGLCATQCFDVYHTKLCFWEPADTKMEKRNTQL